MDHWQNVRAEGPLSQWLVACSLRVDRAVIDLPAPTVRGLDTRCLDFSDFFPSEVFPPDFVQRHARTELRAPLEVVVRPKQAIILSDDKQIITTEVQLSLRLRKARSTAAVDVNLRKFRLYLGP